MKTKIYDEKCELLLAKIKMYSLNYLKMMKYENGI